MGLETNTNIEDWVFVISIPSNTITSGNKPVKHVVFDTKEELDQFAEKFDFSFTEHIAINYKDLHVEKNKQYYNVEISPKHEKVSLAGFNSLRFLNTCMMWGETFSCYLWAKDKNDALKEASKIKKKVEKLNVKEPNYSVQFKDEETIIEVNSNYIACDGTSNTTFLLDSSPHTITLQPSS